MAVQLDQGNDKSHIFSAVFSFVSCIMVEESSKQPPPGAV